MSTSVAKKRFWLKRNCKDVPQKRSWGLFYNEYTDLTLQFDITVELDFKQDWCKRVVLCSWNVKTQMHINHEWRGSWNTLSPQSSKEDVKFILTCAWFCLQATNCKMQKLHSQKSTQQHRRAVVWMFSTSGSWAPPGANQVCCTV